MSICFGPGAKIRSSIVLLGPAFMLQTPAGKLGNAGLNEKAVGAGEATKSS